MSRTCGNYTFHIVHGSGIRREYCIRSNALLIVSPTADGSSVCYCCCCYCSRFEFPSASSYSLSFYRSRAHPSHPADWIEKSVNACQCICVYIVHSDTVKYACTFRHFAPNNNENHRRHRSIAAVLHCTTHKSAHSHTQTHEHRHSHIRSEAHKEHWKADSVIADPSKKQNRPESRNGLCR